MFINCGLILIRVKITKMNFDSNETKIDLLLDFTVLVESLDILILNLQKTTLPMNIFNYAVCLAGCYSIPFQQSTDYCINANQT